VQAAPQLGEGRIQLAQGQKGRVVSQQQGWVRAVGIRWGLGDLLQLVGDPDEDKGRPGLVTNLEGSLSS
jgi:hypothetical protein